MELAYCNKTINNIYYKGCPVNTVYYKDTKVYEKPSGFVRIGFYTSALVNYNNGCCSSCSPQFYFPRAYVNYQANFKIRAENCTNIDCLCVVLTLKSPASSARLCATSICMGGINNVGHACILQKETKKAIILCSVGDDDSVCSQATACAYYNSSCCLQCCNDIVAANSLFGSNTQCACVYQFRTGHTCDNGNSLFQTCVYVDTPMCVEIYKKCNSTTFNCCIGGRVINLLNTGCDSCNIANNKANGCLTLATGDTYIYYVCL